MEMIIRMVCLSDVDTDTDGSVQSKEGNWR